MYVYVSEILQISININLKQLVGFQLQHHHCWKRLV